MAFNTGPGDAGIPNMTGRSEGTGPNRVFESLFGGLADTFQNVTTIKDKNTQNAIMEDARSVFDQTNQDFGVAPPAGIEGEVDSIKTLQAAFQQGKISQTNYYGRLATKAKQLRTKYPGYESFVDDAIMSVTGTRPANSYRDSLFNEMDAIAKSASDQEKFRRQFEKDNAGEIASLFPDDYFQNPGKYDFNTVQAEVSKLKARDYKIKAETQGLELALKQGQVNDKQVEKAVAQDLSLIVETQLNKAIGANGANFEEVMAQFMTGKSTDLEALTNNIGEAETRLRSQLRARVQSAFVAKGLMTQEDANKAIESAMYPIIEAKKAIVGGDFQYAGRLATINKYIADRSLNDIFKSSPEAVVGAGLSRMNEAVGAEFFNKRLDKFDTIAAEAVGRAAGNLDPNVIKNVMTSGDQQVARATITGAMEALKNPNLTGPDLTNIVNQFFGPQAFDFMSGENVNPEDLERMYTTLLDPQVTKAIKEKGTPEDLKTYTEFALEKFRAIPSFRAAAGTLNNITEKVGEISLQYDPKTNRIAVQTIPGFTMSGQRETIQRVIGSMNKALAVLDPLAEANGVETQQLLNDLVSGMVEMERVPGKGFFSWMIDQMSMSAQASEMKGGQALQEISADGGEIDFVQAALQSRGRRTTPSGAPDRQTADLLDMIGQSEGAGYDTLFGYSERKYGAVPTQMTLGEIIELQKRMGRELGSSAIGKYQIIRSTLTDAIRAMGLPLDTVFDEKTQDRIATEFLLARRGYNEYKSGRMSRDKFLENLAQEWASIPTASGLSFYHGDKMGNKASAAGRKLAASV